jgi:DNA repair exonuclease SbcCD nuclease subunit
MKLIHAADIHLDSPLRGLDRYDGAPSGDLRVATRRAFTNLIDYCLEEKADALLLAGDVYDGDWQDFNTGLFFVKQLARLREAGIPVYAVLGNHDAASTITRRLKLPDNVTLLSHKAPETTINEHLGLAVHGQSFAKRDVTEDLAAAYPATVPGLLNVGLLHTALTGRVEHVPYAPTTQDRLASKGYGYWALGHVHRAEVVSKSPWIVFPGNLQGRSVRETGEKGFVVVSAEGSDVTGVEKVPCDVARWHDLTVDVASTRSADDVPVLVQHALEAAVAASGNRLVAARVRLTGRGAIHSTLVRDLRSVEANVRAAASDVSGDVWVEKVVVQTLPEVDLEKVRERPDALGHVARSIHGASEDPEALKALTAELRPLLDKLPPGLGEGRPLFDPSDSESLRAFLAEVEGALVPMLLDAEERP